jgi:hypothetical protein
MLLINEGFTYAYEGSQSIGGDTTVADQGVLGRIKGTYNGSNQSVVAAPGAGKKIVVKALVISVEDAGTDVQFNSRTGTTNTLVGPNLDFAANNLAVLPYTSDGWFETLANQALVITSTGNTDLLGTYRVVNA